MGRQGGRLDGEKKERVRLDWCSLASQFADDGLFFFFLNECHPPPSMLHTDSFPV